MRSLRLGDKVQMDQLIVDRYDTRDKSVTLCCHANDIRFSDRDVFEAIVAERI